MITFEELLNTFEKEPECVDETTFYFKSGSKEAIKYIGYISGYEKSYKVGYCDNINGEEFKTAKELFEAKIWDGKFIKDLFDDIVICTIGGQNIIN